MTICGAGIALVLSLIGVLNLSVAEEIIIALLALIAIDALNERLNLLERLEAKLNNLPSGQKLRSRADILTPPVHAKNASEICILVIHGSSVIVSNMGFFEDKIKNGCKIRFILLNPDSPSIQTWNLRSKFSDATPYIKSSMEQLQQLMLLPEVGKRCEVRLAEVFMPFSLFAIDLSKRSGSMIVEYAGYKLPIDERPHVHLTVTDSPYWFEYYRQQFEKVWSEATIWMPHS
ncbi:MAG: hypothetical protein KDJ52_03740 [Anaerolineae bacterium]|nr:hypothetical protein [Anaerolineae bacterium]